jgi:hypothetical protein
MAVSLERENPMGKSNQFRLGSVSQRGGLQHQPNTKVSLQRTRKPPNNVQHFHYFC